MLSGDFIVDALMFNNQNFPPLHSEVTRFIYHKEHMSEIKIFIYEIIKTEWLVQGLQECVEIKIKSLEILCMLTVKY